MYIPDLYVRIPIFQRPSSRELTNFINCLLYNKAQENMDIDPVNRYSETVSADEIKELRDRILQCQDLESVRTMFRGIIIDTLGTSSKV